MYQCPRCLVILSRKQRLMSHLRRKLPCEIKKLDKNSDLVMNPGNQDSNGFMNPNQEMSGHFDRNSGVYVKKAGKLTQNRQIVTKKSVKKTINKTVKQKKLGPQQLIDPNEQQQCPRCFAYMSQDDLLTHLRSGVPCNIKKISENQGSQLISKKYQKENMCPHCDKCFSTNSNMNKHIRRIHQRSYQSKKPIEVPEIEPYLEDSDEVDSEEEDEINEVEEVDELRKTQAEVALLKEKLAKLEKGHEEIRNKPTTNQNILQVVCVSSDQNYLDMLTEELGFSEALGYIQNCALSDVAGDCKLLQKIYFDSSTNAPIRYVDHRRNQVEYVNEKHESVVTKGSQLGKKLASNLQNSYLKGINYLIKQNLQKRMCPNKFLADYDLQMWNRHIYELSEGNYHKKLMKHLDIPHK